MSIHKYLTTGQLEIERYSRHPDYSKNAVAFTGVPRKHPYDGERLLLVTDPLSSHAVFCEFRITDIVHVEELSNLVSEDGDSVQTVRIWVRKGCWGLRYEPFVVEDTPACVKILTDAGRD